MSIHQKLFGQIAEKISPDLSLVHEISELLNISYDSAYRRLRGEKTLSVEEVVVLCHHFDLSMDSLLHLNGDSHVLFKKYVVEPDNFNPNQWLDNTLKVVQRLHDAGEKHIVYAAKDPPIINYFQFPEMAAFKFYFWSKTLFLHLDNKEVKFNLKNIDKEFSLKCKQIADLSMKISSTEIWNEDTFQILMRQIEYHWVSGYFENRETLEQLLDSIELWLHHTQKQVELGFRFQYGKEAVGIPNSYVFYENEVVINDNTIHTTADGVSTVYLTYNVLGLLVSSNASFCKSIANFHKVLMSKSNLISQTGEKERNRFFNKHHAIIQQFRSEHL